MDLTVTTTVLPSYVPGPYRPPLPPLPAPSLVWLCITALYPHPDLLHLLPVRLNYRNELSDIDLLDLDPRLWASLVQIYDGLPPSLATYRIPLNDVHLPLLQDIPCTLRFSLLTLLTCATLDDDNISQLKFLHSLTALDASNSSLSPYGLQSLAATLLLLPMRGPWPLRILSLRNCRLITNHVFPHLERFPLLSVIDLRGTRCTSSPSGFSGGGQPRLFHPTTLLNCLSYLREISPDIDSSPNPFTLLIDRLSHTPNRRPPCGPAYHSSAVVTFSSTSSRLRIDHADAIVRRAQAKEDSEHHEKNKAAWYRRQDALEDNSSPYLMSERFKVEPIMRTPLPIPRPPTRVTSRPVASTSALRRPEAFTVFCSDVSTDIPSIDPQTQKAASVMRMESRTRPQPTPRPPTRMNSVPKKIPSIPPIDPPIQKPTSIMRVEPRPSPLNPSLQNPSTRPTRINPIDEPFMLYRDPPPWSALSSTLSTLRSDEIRRKDLLKTALAMRNSEFAEIDRSGHKAVAAKRHLENLLAKRTEMHQTFGLPKRPSLDLQKGAVKRRAEIAESSSSKRLVPISRVPTPVFTQELLDVSAKENKKAKAAEASDFPVKQQKRLSIPSGTAAKRRKSEPSKKTRSFDWKKWGNGGA